MLERYLKKRTKNRPNVNPVAKVGKWGISFNEPATDWIIGKNEFVMVNVYLDIKAIYVGIKVISGNDVDKHSFIIRRLKGHTSRLASPSLVKTMDEISPFPEKASHTFMLFENEDTIGIYFKE